MKLTVENAHKYLAQKRCRSKNTLGKPCKSPVVFGACKYHMTDEEKAMGEFIAVFTLDAVWKSSESERKNYKDANSPSRVGSGRVTYDVLRELESYNRYCGRPRHWGGECGNRALQFVDGCRHHLTPAEEDVRFIVEHAFWASSRQRQSDSSG